MSARLRCPGCVAIRTPDEVDFEHTPVRCKECGTAVEVFDEQLEALDRQLAMADKQLEMQEPYPRYPIYPRDTTQVTDSDSQTPLIRTLQVLLGDRETISRSATSGMVSVFLMSAFFVGSVQFNLDIEGLSFLRDPNSTKWLRLICLPLVFAIVAGGRPIGWLFIRPVASILHIAYPELDLKRIWIISTTAIWLPVAILVLYPYQQLPLLSQGILLTGVSIWATMSGIVGGFMGAVVPIGKGRKEWAECSAIGGSVTGSLLLVGFHTLSLIISPNIKPFGGVGNVVELCLVLAGISFVSMIPYALIWPLFVGASKLIRFGKEFHISYVAIGGSLWVVIGYLAGTKMLTDTNFINGLVYSGIMGVCGACSGWAIGEFEAGA